MAHRMEAGAGAIGRSETSKGGGGRGGEWEGAGVGRCQGGVRGRGHGRGKSFMRCPRSRDVSAELWTRRARNGSWKQKVFEEDVD